MSEDAPLTERQRLMMAYVDDELLPTERAEFEAAMAEDPDLAAQAVEFKTLMDVSRSLTLSEPTDHEIRRFWAKFYNRSEWQVGWVLLIAGLLVAGGEGIYLLLTTPALSWVFKTAVLSILVGGALLLWNTLRLKIRTSHFDRYRGVMR